MKHTRPTFAELDRARITKLAERGIASPEAVRQAGLDPADYPAMATQSAGRTERFGALRVTVADGVIYRLNGLSMKAGVLGPLAGATAEVTDGTSRHTLTRVLTVAGAFTKKAGAYAFVVTADGQIAEAKLQGAGMIRRAQAEAVRFNVLAPQDTAG